MKIALITDQHLDGRKGSLIFWEYWKKFYDNVFFPTLKKKGVTTIFDLGDTFDNRKNIDFNTCHRVKSQYFDLLKDYQVHMILGNHCTYYKNTNAINSPELLLDQYENITIYSEPEEITMGSKKFLMLPWINKENSNVVSSLLETSSADICCGHLELSGFEMNAGLVMDHGMDPKLFHRFKRVWSGHYHHKSNKGNIQYLGNPYQMYWNDYKDVRGFHIYDTESDKLEFIKNPYEIFDKIFYNDKTTDYDEYDVSDYRDKYLKIVVEEKSDYHMFEKLVDRLYTVGAHDIKIVENLLEEDATEVDSNMEVKDTMTLLNEYIDEVEMTVDKSDLKSLMKSLYIESCEVA